MTVQILKIVWESWPKFKQVTKKVPTPLTLQLLNFDEKSTFDFFPLIWGDKASLALSTQIKKKSKVDFSSKAKSCNVRYLLVTKNTVPLEVLLKFSTTTSTSTRVLNLVL